MYVCVLGCSLKPETKCLFEVIQLRDTGCQTQRTCLLYDTADMSSVSHSRHARCVIQQTCLLCHVIEVIINSQGLPRSELSKTNFDTGLTPGANNFRG